MASAKLVSKSTFYKRILNKKLNDHAKCYQSLRILFCQDNQQNWKMWQFLTTKSNFLPRFRKAFFKFLRINWYHLYKKWRNLLHAGLIFSEQSVNQIVEIKKYIRKLLGLFHCFEFCPQARLYIAFHGLRIKILKFWFIFFPTC